eukprot:Awhi_evm1s3663
MSILGVALINFGFITITCKAECLGPSPYFNSSKKPLKIQYHDWAISETVAHMFKFLVEEQLGIPAEL